VSLVYGYIFEWDGFRPDEQSASNSERFGNALLSIRLFTLPENPPKGRGLVRNPRWAIYRFLSPKPLLGEEPHARGLGHGYAYYVDVRVNEKTGTLVIAGPRYVVTEEVVRTFNAYIRPSLRRKVLNVKNLSDHLLERGSEKRFAVTHLTADVPGYGTAVSSIALTGDDIGGADFLVAERSEFTIRQVGVRPVENRAECGRFGSVGSVQFRTDLIDNFERFLVYAYDCGLYID
jgi:hypothetical protein